jgi:hypothetical protein
MEPDVEDGVTTVIPSIRPDVSLDLVVFADLLPIWSHRGDGLRDLDAFGQFY